MARGGPERQLGDKIGPKLAQIVLQYQLAARRGLAPVEARIRQAATQALIDRAGHEAADLYRPMWDRLEELKGDQLHPLMARHVQRVSSGRHQWESVLGHIGFQAAGALGSVISNVIWPVTSEINLHDRNTPYDAATAAAAWAAGLDNYGDADRTAGEWGINPGSFTNLTALAQAIPDAGTLFDLVNRGLLSEADLLYWLHRGSLPEQLRGPVAALRRRILTPADAALAQLRGDLTEPQALAIAEQNGLDRASFATLVANTGEPPGAQQLAEALRRGFIDKQRFARGIRQSRVRDEWIGVLEDLQYSPVPTADAIDAALRGWVTEETARKIAEQNGVLPDQIQILVDNAGNPPSNEQLLELRRRGYIDQRLLVKGIREGRTRDEWIPQIEQLAYSPLGSADAIDAWLRGHVSEEGAKRLLTENGLLPRDQDLALANAGNPLALMQLLEAYRRQFIDRATFLRGFRESRYRDEWAETALKLGHSPMSTADAVDAVLQSQLGEPEAKVIADQNGLEAQDFGVLLRTAGDPLARTELQQLFNRKLIDLDTYKQGLRESRLKNKYVDLATQLHVREPEAYQVLRWITYGIVTEQAGIEQLEQIGYSAEVAHRMVAEAAVTSVGPHKELAAAEVSALYADRIVSYEQALALLKQLHYTDTTAQVILQLADYKLRQKILNSGVSAVRAHYLAYRIDDTTATADLLALKLPQPAVALYLQVWGLDRLAHPKQLTEAQIVKAAKGNMFTPQGDLTTQQWQDANQKAGHERLVQLGYDDTDASLLLAGA